VYVGLLEGAVTPTPDDNHATVSAWRKNRDMRTIPSSWAAFLHINHHVYQTQSPVEQIKTFFSS
jgi:hypothetical protein